MNKDEQKIFIEQIYKELDEFKKKMLSLLTKEEVFESAYKILAFNEIGNFIIRNANKYSRKGFCETNIVQNLYNEFLSTNYNLTEEDLSCFISEENKSLEGFNKRQEIRNLNKALNDFYGEFAPYDKLDETELFSSDDEDLELTNKHKRKHIIKRLDLIIENEEREKIKEKAKELKQQVKKLDEQNEL